MNRSELTLAIAAVLVGAMLLGWILRWIFGRMNAYGPRDVLRSAEMAARLHDAEDAQVRAEGRLADAKADLAQARAELDATLASLSKARAQTEEIRAAYRAAMAERGSRGG